MWLARSSRIDARPDVSEGVRADPPVRLLAVALERRRVAGDRGIGEDGGDAIARAIGDIEAVVVADADGDAVARLGVDADPVVDPLAQRMVWVWSAMITSPTPEFQ